MEMDRMPDVTSSDSDEGFDRSMSNLCTRRTKVFNDIIHGEMEIPYLCYEIINTPQFQRLRNIKQLAMCSFLYPSASHNRFEHCIGTSYIAGKYGRILQRNQPELQIDETDILCLEIAGLCHDIGHGPFSHLWENFVGKYADSYSHEEISVRMLDYMIQQNELWNSFQAAGLEERDLVFIKEAIYGKPLPAKIEFEGRSPSKLFLYQIISNYETKIDVDKFDYLLRDAQQLNIRISFDYERVLNNSRVIRVDEGGNSQWKIVYRQKIVHNLEDLFRERYRMHQRAYQHKVTKIIEEMLLDGLVEAEPHFRVYAEDGKVYKLSTAHLDMSAFITLTDSVFELIVNRREGGRKAAAIFNRILKRDLYVLLGYFRTSPISDEWTLFLNKYPRIHVLRAHFNYGKGEEHPLNVAMFYEKDNPDTGFSIGISESATESKYYLIYKDNASDVLGLAAAVDNMDLLRADLRKWSTEMNLQLFFE